jgi:hypothetical protein
LVDLANTPKLRTYREKKIFTEHKCKTNILIIVTYRVIKMLDIRQASRDMKWCFAIPTDQIDILKKMAWSK